MGRIRRSWELAKESWNVLRATPSLLWFPVASGIVTLMVTASFVIPAIDIYKGMQHDKMPPMGYVLAACYYLVSYFVVIFFNTGLVAAAHENLQGRPAGFADGLGIAAKRLPAILGWTVIAATIGTLLKFVSDRSGVVGSLVVSFLGAAWNIVTFFVIPGMVIDHGGPITSLKGSLKLLKSTWGENLIGQGGIGIVTALFALGPVIPVVLMCMTGVTAIMIAGVVGALLYWLALAVVSSSLSGVYQTALYTYATSKQIPSGFSEESVMAAFKTRTTVVDKFKRFGG